MRAIDLVTLPSRALYALLETGHPIDPDVLAGRDYNGTSLGLPHFIEQLTWKKFQKTFYRDERTGALRGCNVRCEQNPLDEPWLPQRHKDGTPRTFGPYEVVDGKCLRMPVAANQGLVIHYGRGPNPPPLSRLRDPIVALHPGDASLLLGWTYVDLGVTTMRTPSFFSLEHR